MWKQIKIRCWIFLFITLVTFIWPSLVNANCNYCLVKTSLYISVINYPFCVWWIPEKLKETICLCYEGSEFVLVLIIIPLWVLYYSFLSILWVLGMEQDYSVTYATTTCYLKYMKGKETFDNWLKNDVWWQLTFVDVESISK